MKRFIVGIMGMVLTVSLLFSGQVSADFFQGTPVYDGRRNANGFEQITSLSSATGITAPAGTRLALIQIEAQAVRYRDDGTDPTSSVGMNLDTEDILFYVGDFSVIKFIEVTSGAILNINYYK